MLDIKLDIGSILDDGNWDYILVRFVFPFKLVTWIICWGIGVECLLWYFNPRIPLQPDITVFAFDSLPLWLVEWPKLSANFSWNGMTWSEWKQVASYMEYLQNKALTMFSSHITYMIRKILRPVLNPTNGNHYTPGTSSSTGLLPFRYCG
jgi:hypothetical protein